MDTDELAARVDDLAQRESFTGVVRVDRGDATLVSAAYSLADRAWEIPNRPDTRFGMASGSKTFTALAVVSLIVEGRLRLDTPVRTILGDDLPLIDDRVTIEHLLGHTSGIGDYLDEDEWTPTDHVLPLPVHTYRVSEDFVPTLDGHPQRAEPGSEFVYCNGGYVVLSIVLERMLGQPLASIIASRVFEPAGMRDTAFLEMDALPGDVARGYLGADGLRSNVLILPVVATGDGGVHTSAADMTVFWRALHAGRIVPVEWVARMTEPLNWEPEEELHYGLGCYSRPPAAVMIGMDAGVSFWSLHDHTRDLTCTVLANTAYAAWPMAELLMTESFPG
ncbi:MAG: beta-lactamase family protein [Propionibacteriaceae bacterium]|nr:beta-lactamase family protein [Propionibacteriaceae bacterium]